MSIAHNSSHGKNRLAIAAWSGFLKGFNIAPVFITYANCWWGSKDRSGNIFDWYKLTLKPIFKSCRAFSGFFDRFDPTHPPNFETILFMLAFFLEFPKIPCRRHGLLNQTELKSKSIRYFRFLSRFAQFYWIKSHILPNRRNVLILFSGLYCAKILISDFYH